MIRLAITLGLCTFCAIAGERGAPKPDEYIIAAYAMGQQDLLVSIIDGEITWEVASK